MNKRPITSESGALGRLTKSTFATSLLPALVLLLTIQSSHAGSATWSSTPSSGNWNTAGNWTAGGPPNGAADTATFNVSNITSVSTSANTEVNGIAFDPGASPFTITARPSTKELDITGAGIANNSGSTQNFVADGNGNSLPAIFFKNGATAGSLIAITNNGGTFSGAVGGVTSFLNTSTAGNATFTTNGGSVSGASGGAIVFSGGSNAGTGTFINNGATASSANGGLIQFTGTSNAGSGTFRNQWGTVSGAGGAVMQFKDNSTAANAFLLAYDGGVPGASVGSIQFLDNSTGGKARVVAVDGYGNLDISGHNPPDVTVGSIEGGGSVFLGANNLSVGSNKLSRSFFGVIQDGGAFGGTGGSLTKIGRHKMTLSFQANTYTGGTAINDGTLLVNNASGSGTGSGPVQVNAGTLGGTGTIAGAVTVATGVKPAFLAPGSGKKPATLTLQSTLTFNSSGTYKVDLNSSTAKADKVIANGTTINGGAQFSLTSAGSGTLTPGTVFTVIDNTVATPIAGTFSNLPDGSTFTSNGNTYQANYEGGNGNDLTLTVQ